MNLKRGIGWFYIIQGWHCQLLMDFLISIGFTLLWSVSSQDEQCPGADGLGSDRREEAETAVDDGR
jgi:hypothetical protein